MMDEVRPKDFVTAPSQGWAYGNPHPFNSSK